MRGKELAEALFSRGCWYVKNGQARKTMRVSAYDVVVKVHLPRGVPCILLGISTKPKLTISRSNPISCSFRKEARALNGFTIVRQNGRRLDVSHKYCSLGN
jgi:hypothetical protein